MNKKNMRDIFRIIALVMSVLILSSDIDVTGFAYDGVRDNKSTVSDNDAVLFCEENDDDKILVCEDIVDNLGDENKSGSVNTTLPDGTPGKIEYRTEGECLYIEGSGDIAENALYPWYDPNIINKKITSVKVSLKDITRTNSMFAYMSYIKSIDFTDSDLSKVVDMSYMFYKCESLSEIKLSGIGAKCVNNMSYMFDKCTALQKVDLSGIQTDNVKDMSYMFNECESLREIGLSGLKTGNVENMSHMFYNCESIYELDLRNFDFSNVKTMDSAFKGCSNLYYIFLDKVNSCKLENISYLFSGCNNLSFSSIDFYNWDTSNVIVADKVFGNCYTLKSFDFTKCNFPKVQRINDFFYNCSNLETVNFENCEFSDLEKIDDIFHECKSLKNVNFKNCKISNATNLEGLFRGDDNLAEADFSGADFSSALSTKEMFYSCDKLEKADFSGADFSSVLSTEEMFENCDNLIEADFSGADFSSAVSMENMFYSCGKLEKADFSGIDLSAATSMNYMFYKCNELSDVIFDKIKTGKINSMEAMFYNCKKIKTIDLKNLNTKNLITTEGMFAYCGSLQEVDVHSLDVNEETILDNMFYACKSLKKIDISNFIIDKSVELFKYCYELATIVAPGKGTGSLKLYALYGNKWYAPDSDEAITEYPIGDKPVVLRRDNKGLNYEYFNITAKESSYGKVEPNNIKVLAGFSQKINIYPSDDNVIQDVLVNGESIGAKDEFIIDSVSEDISIEVIYKVKQYDINALAHGNGKISNEGVTKVKYGESQTYTFTPFEDSKIDKVLVDGNEIGAVNTYTFSDVHDNHDIEVIFKKIKYTVSFNGMGADVSPASVKCEIMKPFGDALPVPSMAGRYFAGWYTKDINGERITSDTIFTYEHDITLYAHWENINIVKGQKYDVSGFFEGVENICGYTIIKANTGKATINKKGILKAKKAGLIKVAPCIKEGKKKKTLEDKAIEILISKPTFINNKIRCKVNDTIHLSEYLVNLPTNTNEMEFSVPSNKKAYVSLDSKFGEIKVSKKGKVKITLIIKNVQGYTSKINTKLIVENK